MAQDTQSIQFKKAALRNELKEWERKFAETHNGQKPGKQDIKADADIAAKYREYDSLRVPPKPAAPQQRKRKANTDLPSQSPTQEQRLAATPQKPRQNIEEQYVSPSTARQLFTPTINRAFIGPTPQKDGQVLGLFDLLPNETPSRSNRTPLKDLEGNEVAQTPSKRTEDGEDIFTPSKRFSRTPQSSGKRFMLDMFVTPQKRRRLDEQGTPSSVRHDFPATPAFLRRDSQRLGPLAEGGESPEVRRFLPRKSFGRSLSSMIAAAREEAEHEHDDEEEAMREAEGGANPFTRKSSGPKVQVEDSQMPATVQLDQDGFVPSDIEEDEEEEQDGQPRRIWKKKGLKRQTKRTNMRPAAMKPSARPESQTLLEDSDSDDEAVPETQAVEAAAAPGEEYDSSVEGDKAGSQPMTKLKKAGELVKKAAKKVNEAAHANYRRLNIKNKNSKANGRGKFGRRR